MHAHESGATVKQRVARDCRPAGSARQIKTLSKGEVKDQISHRRSDGPDHLLN